MRVAWFTLESRTAALDRAAVDGTTARAIANITGATPSPSMTSACCPPDRLQPTNVHM